MISWRGGWELACGGLYLLLKVGEVAWGADVVKHGLSLGDLFLFPLSCWGCIN